MAQNFNNEEIPDFDDSLLKDAGDKLDKPVEKYSFEKFYELKNNKEYSLRFAPSEFNLEYNEIWR